MQSDHTIIICPLPGMGHCIWERCTFWDEGRGECACDCFDTGGPGEADAPGSPDWPCVISYDEDND